MDQWQGACSTAAKTQSLLMIICRHSFNVLHCPVLHCIALFHSSQALNCLWPSGGPTHGQPTTLEQTCQCACPSLPLHRSQLRW